MSILFNAKKISLIFYGSFIKSLHITAASGVITNYGNTLLEITASITIYDIITNYVVTV